MTMAKNRVPADDFCAGCGMCCDGTLHTKARLQTQEDDRLLEAGGLERITENNGKQYFRQPCPYLRDNLCSTYETRFSVCRAYRCAILQSFENGLISSDDAQAKITVAKTLRAKIFAVSPNDASYASRYKSRLEIEGALPTLFGEERQKALEKLLKFVALDTYLDTWFRKKGDQVGQAESPVTPD